MHTRFILLNVVMINNYNEKLVVASLVLPPEFIIAINVRVCDDDINFENIL